MKKLIILIGQPILIALFATTVVFAAPNIDGSMYYSLDSDWKNVGTGVTRFNTSSTDSAYTNTTYSFNKYTNLTNVSVEGGDASGGDAYDVEELGVYVNNNILYIGLQTGFDLKNGVGDIKSGDFIFNFDEPIDGNGTVDKRFYDNVQDADNFAFDFNIKNDGTVDFTLLSGTLTGDAEKKDYGKDWEIESGTNPDFVFENAGVYTVENDTGTYEGYNHTIEAEIDLNLFAQQTRTDLTALFSGYANQYTSVTMFWQPSCGNDFLAARTEFDYKIPSGGDTVPEPETLLLFGIGLLSAGAMGRKRQKK